MTDRNSQDSGASRPRSEPEIIPPDRSGGNDGKRGIWISVNEQGGTRRVYVTRPSPFSIILLLLILGLIAVGAFIVLLSVALIWIPVLIIFVIAVILTMTFSQYWQRFRNWIARR